MVVGVAVTINDCFCTCLIHDNFVRPLPVQTLFSLKRGSFVSAIVMFRTTNKYNLFCHRFRNCCMYVLWWKRPLQVRQSLPEPHRNSSMSMTTVPRCLPILQTFLILIRKSIFDPLKFDPRTYKPHRIHLSQCKILLNDFLLCIRGVNK